MTTVFEIRGITKTFGGVTALSGVDITAIPEGVTAIIGPNGAGKSTLANIISGFTKPDAGKVLFDETDITRLPPHKRAKLGISRTFQNLKLFTGLSVLQNVYLGLYSKNRNGLPGCMFSFASDKDGRKLLSEAKEALDTFGLAHLAGRAVESLSFGDAKLVELARAIVSKPKMIVMDEPAAGLTIRDTQKLGEKITELANGGITVILVEHNMKMIMEISERIIVLEYGKVIAVGTPLEIQSNELVIDAYLGRNHLRD
ncbi:MAG: ABC transporter ATP-binding protein, partial [Synergistaceae bacterium]|nr:ABC transporter ATP-binding protein [Synergistaceae bacterium]